LATSETTLDTGQVFELAYEINKPAALEKKGSFLSTNRYSAEKEEIFLYGGGVNYHTPIVKFGITYRNNYLLDDINLDRSILNTNLAFKVGNHELGGFLGYNIFRNTINERDFYATAAYRYTMGTPI